MKIYPKSQIERMMTGQWEILLGQYWNKGVFSGRHQSCPLCGGKDRFRWGESKNTPELKGCGFGICNQCGSHPGLWWFMQASGMDFKDALSEIGENFLRVEPNQEEMPQRQEQTFEPAPRIKCTDDCYAKSYINRMQNSPEWDEYYWRCHDLIESVLMFQKEVDPLELLD